MGVAICGMNGKDGCKFRWDGWTWNLCGTNGLFIRSSGKDGRDFMWNRGCVLRGRIVKYLQVGQTYRTEGWDL